MKFHALVKIEDGTTNFYVVEDKGGMSVTTYRFKKDGTERTWKYLGEHGTSRTQTRKEYGNLLAEGWVKAEMPHGMFDSMITSFTW